MNKNTDNKQVVEFQCSVNDTNHRHKIAVFYPWGEHELTEKYCAIIYVPEDKFQKYSKLKIEAEKNKKMDNNKYFQEWQKAWDNWTLISKNKQN